MKTSIALTALLVASSPAGGDAFVAKSSSQRLAISLGDGIKRRSRQQQAATFREQPAMTDGLDIAASDDSKETGVTSVVDTTTLGALTVPSVGIGTISWSSDNRK